jgi:hypothetical protein
MTVEYVLLISLFVYLLMGALTSQPAKTFKDYGPRLGARVEKQLVTGDGFKDKGQGVSWKE